MHFFNLNRLLSLAIISMFATSIHAFVDPNEINERSVQKELMALEASAGGRIGVSAINTVNSQRIQYRAQERFPMQSTFKVMVVAAVLKQSMTDNQLLQKKVIYTKEEIATWSPVTEKHIDSGMTISELCAAAIMYSDNTAANLLIEELGGTQAVTAFARSIGDNAYNLDSGEAEKTSIPSDFNYTSTPEAMEKSLQQLTLGNILGTTEREQLLTWMKENTTGNLRIRAGVPQGWIVADKTGSGDYGITNDIGVLYPPKCKPIVAAIYFIQNKETATSRPDVVASAARIIIDELAETDECIKIK